MNLSKIVITTVTVIGTVTIAGCIKAAINKKVKELAAEASEEQDDTESK